MSVEWLAKNLGSEDLLLLDASPAPVYAAGHIPGARSADLFAHGGAEAPVSERERRSRAWGTSPGEKVVVHDQGGPMWATCRTPGS